MSVDQFVNSSLTKRYKPVKTAEKNYVSGPPPSPPIELMQID